LSKIKVGAVSYLNTKPLLYGIQRSAALLNRIELVTDYPARIADMLLNGQIDIGLVPVAIIPRLKEHYIVSDYCIGAEGPVASVALFSEVPLEKIETVLLDYQSRTSVNLAKILLRDHWNISPLLEDATEGYTSRIQGTTAGVVIGDRAFEQRHRSPYVYDLAEAWIAHTGLPFVFAAWVANKPIDAEFISLFNTANALGLQHLDAVLAENPYKTYDLHTYYTENISYPLTDRKKEGLSLFLKRLQG